MTIKKYVLNEIRRYLTLFLHSGEWINVASEVFAVLGVRSVLEST